MPEESTLLTIKDFAKSNWQEIVESCQKKECHYYSSVFLKRAKEFEEQNDKTNQDIFSILGGLTSMMLKSESPSEPYQPVAVFNDRRSAIIDDYSEDVINLLSEYLGKINDPELRARIADVVWLRKREFKAAQTAINSYLETAVLLEHPEKWTQCAERIERAFRLSLQLGKKGDSYKKVVNHIEAVLKKYNGSDPLFLSQRLMALLLEVRYGYPQYYIDLSEKIALHSEKSGNYYRARSYWEIKANWHQLASDKEGERESLKNAAETYVKEAASATSGLAASTHQQKAIEAYRRFGGDKDRIEELHVTLLEYQEQTLSEMNSYSSPGIDISESIKNSIDRVKGKTLHDALFELVLMVPSPDIKELRREVEESAAKYPLQHLFPSVKVNEKGKVTAKASSMLSSDPSEIEQAYREGMFRNLEFHHQIYAQSIVDPVRKQISLEHNVRIEDFYSIVSNNPFVPQGREYLYALGFKSGFDGEYEVSLHLLIPQFENSIRHILTEAGKITSGIDSDGIQDEKSLNTTLYLPEIKELIDENIIFDLQGLLVERFGANLRNLMAHGLMSHHEFYSHNGRYLWCLILKICCLPVIRYLREQEIKEFKNEENQ